MRIIISILIILPLLVNSSFSQIIDPSGNLDTETVRKWDAYIRKHAPSDSALKIVNAFAQRHYLYGRPSVAFNIFRLYKPLFKNRVYYFDRQIRSFEEQLLATAPQKDIEHLYDAYVVENAPSESAFIAIQRLADRYIKEKQWDTAAALFRIYKPIFPAMSKRFDDIINILLAEEEGLRVNNLGPDVNTKLQEWDPNPTPDGRYLYFSAYSRRGGQGVDDVWVSELKDGKWSKPKNLGPGINSNKRETVDNVTSDGNGLFLSGDFEGTFGRFDIYYASKSVFGWSNLEHFPYPINTEHTDEAANLTSDGKAVIFCSDRPGGIGDYRPYGTLFHGGINGNEDIYISFKTDTGWSTPVNLGPIINTPYAERAPYLHPDGKTLYFSSEGHPGLGRLDVFVSRRLSEDSWTEWSQPINLGKEINSIYDDLGYKISVNGDSAFFASRYRPEGYGRIDMYSVSLPDIAKPDQVVVVKGMITDTKGNPVSVKIKWEDLETGKLVGQVTTDPRTGTYVITLPVGRHYGFYAEHEDYYPASRSIDLRHLKGDLKVEEVIELISLDELKRGKNGLELNNIFFDFDKYSLRIESFPELNRLSGIIKQLPGQKFLIEGHTDHIGTPEYNMSLSIKRAEVVRNYLVKKGCKKKILKIKGYGSSMPLSGNSNGYGRSQNRRVIVKFIK